MTADPMAGLSTDIAGGLNGAASEALRTANGSAGQPSIGAHRGIASIWQYMCRGL